MPNNTVATAKPRLGAQSALRHAAVAWFLVAAVGQAAFVYFILAFYGVRTLSGNHAAWNDKPLIDGYVDGDPAGNAMFAAHVLLGAVITLGGLVQLVPAIRRAAPTLHRWTGRLFLTTAALAATSGAWLAIVRGTYLSVVSAVAILANGLLILAFGGLAWRHAVKRRFALHRAWALRAFMVVSGVWFLRVGLMGWAVLSGGLGMNDSLSGPADIVLVFGSYLIPLAFLELYLRADRGGTVLKVAAALTTVLASIYMAVGLAGAIAFMWGPYL